MCPNKRPLSVDLAAFVGRKYPLPWSLLSACESNSILSQS